MVKEHNTALDAQRSIALKFNEPVVDTDNPWADDLLARQDIATWLTNLIATQEPPLTVGLQGQWGTGKTFMLRRWQKQLENDGFRAIYFNAWEDDFCDDPLLAIIGQLSDYFKDGYLKTMARRVAQIAMPLIRENLLGVLKATTGVTIKVDQRGQGNKTFLDAYLEQRGTKDKLKGHLAALSRQVTKEAGHPLVFIIDELDRCRPTFAIELLERVKHIFDVPNTVFVFGLNRDELCKSLASVYGDIKTEVYLRRFFDFEFTLPEVGSVRFAAHLMAKFGLDQVFQSLSDATGRLEPIYDFNNYQRILPKLWSALGLSLRDIDYGIRLIALLSRNVRSGSRTHPYLLTVLIAMKFKEKDFYDALVMGNFRASEIMNYIEGAVRADSSDRNLSATLDYIEGLLYCADSANSEYGERGAAALDELNQVLDDASRKEFLVISRRAQNADRHQLDLIREAISHGRELRVSGNVLGDLAALIDTYQTGLRG